MLKMKPQCEKCSTPLSAMDTAFICSYECTFCASCTDAMGAVCPNCQGELLRRPKRAKGPAAVVAGQVKRKLGGLLGS
ncbi:MAG TPA: DUF1272 domain-containing protein [Nevskiaceae bacterium]|nr:DUF1272 domain-containing protein [Nevskiaceae bacterium]